MTLIDSLPLDKTEIPAIGLPLTVAPNIIFPAGKGHHNIVKVNGLYPHPSRCLVFPDIVMLKPFRVSSVRSTFFF